MGVDRVRGKRIGMTGRGGGMEGEIAPARVVQLVQDRTIVRLRFVGM